MPQRLLGRSDGRALKARGAIRRLAALGITDADDIATLLRLDRQPDRRAPLQRATEDDPSRDERLARAQWAVRWLMALGFSEVEIAAHISRDHTTIAHLLDPVVPRAVSQATLARLLAAVGEAGAERLNLLLPRVAITVLDTCNDKGRVVDVATDSAVAASARVMIRNALLCTSAPVPVVTGIGAFLAQIGEPAHWTFLIGAPCPSGRSPEERLAHLRRLEHEVEHLHRRIRHERIQLERNVPRTPPPSDGHIA